MSRLRDLSDRARGRGPFRVLPGLDVTVPHNGDTATKPPKNDRALFAQEEERRRIARELHDETAQALASLLLGLRSIEEAKELGQARNAAGRLRALVSTTLDGVQRIARGLRPSVLDDLGLGDAIERLAADHAPMRDFVVEVETTGARAPRLPPEVEVALYRVAQEGLTNAAKHASPQVVSIVVHRTGNTVRLVIEDDGKGFDQTVQPSDNQRGLLGMRERVQLVHGSMTVESSTGGGTTISVTVPLQRFTI